MFICPFQPMKMAVMPKHFMQNVCNPFQIHNHILIASFQKQRENIYTTHIAVQIHMDLTVYTLTALFMFVVGARQAFCNHGEQKSTKTQDLPQTGQLKTGERPIFFNLHLSSLGESLARITSRVLFRRGI